MAEDYSPPPTRHLPQWGIRAEFLLSGLHGDFATHGVGSGAYRYVTTDQVRFYPADTSEPIPLADVPPLALSEIFRDIDLFVSVCTIGNNPTWEEPDADDRYERYWRSYNTGELSNTASTRADLLRRLLPQLAIGSQCAFDDRFLRVEGALRTYKIHLGSGSILMSPGDTYLCNVPDRSAPDPLVGLPLPFEGDQMLAIILSKAMLLANDTKITDPTIADQIRGN